MNQLKSAHEARASSAAHTTDETNEATSPALNPTHALLHLPTLFHVPVATGDAQEHANKWVVLMLVALAGTLFTGLGAAAAGVLLSSQGQNPSTGGVSDLQNTFLAGFHDAFIVCAAFAAIGIFTSLVRGNEHKSRQTRIENHDASLPASGGWIRK